jgi:deferrochelatase/peroxidase EfeB
MRPTDPVDDGPGEGGSAPRGLSRRQFLGWLGAAGAGAATGVAAVEVAHRASADDADPSSDVVPFRGTHQAGITTPRQRHLLFASLDVTQTSRDTLTGLLRYWTGAAEATTRGETIAAPGATQGVMWDTGEAVGLSPGRLTLTIGIGPSLFDRDGVDRFGLGARRPQPLVDLPAFETDRLDPALSGGDLCIQACADDEQVAVHAVRELLRLGNGLVTVRWSQSGFVPADVEDATPRNLLGFKDGTNNIRAEDGEALSRFVWVGSEGPAWLRGGTYLVARRINMRIDRWDGARLREQEDVIGRSKGTGAPLSGRDEHDPLGLSVTRADGAPAIPADAHVRLAAPETNEGRRILRRPYSFVDRDGGEGNLSAGLFFISFQRDPIEQFVPIQRRLAHRDALNEYIRHTGSAVFAVFPGVRDGAVFGDGLF